MHSATTVCGRHPSLPQCSSQKPAGGHGSTPQAPRGAATASLTRSKPTPSPQCVGLAVPNASIAPLPTLDVVVCRYSEDVSWVPRLVAGALIPTRAVIVNHGSKLTLSASHDRGLSRLVEWRTKNAGNECGCYLVFVLCAYPHFAKLTLFLQADAGNLGCLCQPSLPFAYLGRNKWRNMEKGDTDRTPAMVTTTGEFGERLRGWR